MGGINLEHERLLQELGMLAVLLLRLFRKQHEKYPWEVSMTDSGGLSCNLDNMQLWQEEVEQARPLIGARSRLQAFQLLFLMMLLLESLSKIGWKVCPS